MCLEPGNQFASVNATLRIGLAAAPGLNYAAALVVVVAHLAVIVAVVTVVGSVVQGARVATARAPWEIIKSRLRELTQRTQILRENNPEQQRNRQYAAANNRCPKPEIAVHAITTYWTSVTVPIRARARQAGVCSIR
jgi:predicted PurR-regulated permease PerM